MSVEFFVAQHVADLFRNEPRNVGVIIRHDGNTFARFFGEDDDQRIDGRRTKGLPYPEVYRQWVQYWRTHLGDLPGLMRATRDHYRISPAGHLTDVGDSDSAAISNHLYSVLVSEGGIVEALTQGSDADAGAVALEAEIAQVLVERAALARDEANSNPHGVRRQALVQGVVATHTPAFSQVNGKLCVFESVDLTLPRRRTWRDHAGFVAYMFRDIKEATPDADRYTVIRASEDDKASPEGAYALKVLRNEGDLIDWSAPQQREAFVLERALSAQH